MSATVLSDTLLPGYADPVADCQRAFRAVLDAMARPGTVVAFDGPPEAPEGISGTAAGLLLTLCDAATPVWLDRRLAAGAVPSYLRFHTGAPLCDQPADAVFALAARMAPALPLDVLPCGTPDYPDRSATVIVEVDGFGRGEGARLTGPGIETETAFSAVGLPDGFWSAMQGNAMRFPLGIDVILAGPGAVAALPRSTRIEV